MIIDTHQHLFDNAAQQSGINRAAGIDRVVLFPTVVHPENANTTDEFIAEMNVLLDILAGKINAAEKRVEATAAVAARVAENPEHYLGFGSCPAGMNEQDTADWIAAHVLHNKLVGIGEITFPTGNVASLENIFKTAHQSTQKIPLWIHAFNPVTFSDIEQIVKLSEKYPNATVILGHGGGYYWLETLQLVEQRRNIYIDLSAQYSILPLKYYVKEIPDRVIFSSDLPYGDPLSCIRMFEAQLDDAALFERVMSRNFLQMMEG